MITRDLSSHMVRKRYKTFLIRSSGLKNRADLDKFRDSFDKDFCASSSVGILYILYSRKKLYYIGKASQQGWQRMLQHQKNHHKKKWNEFLLLCVKKRYLTTLESLLIAVANPPGNKARTRVPVKKNGLSKR